MHGIDECQGHLSLISNVSRIFSGTSVRCIFFSRPNIHPPANVPEDSILNVTMCNRTDIEIFLERKLSELIQQNLSPSTVPIEDFLPHLITGADDMFLQARLMIYLLASTSLSAAKRVPMIKTVRLPEGLESMYARVLEFLDQRNFIEKDFARWIFMWLAFSRRSLTAKELEETLNVKDIDAKENHEELLDFDRAVMTSGGSLVERASMQDPNGDALVPCYRFIHLSVYEYLESHLSQGPSWFLLSAPQSHLSMVRSCFQYFSLAGENSE